MFAMLDCTRREEGFGGGPPERFKEHVPSGLPCVCFSGSSAFALILCSLCIERLCESKAGLGPEAMAGGPVTSCFSAQLLRAWMAEFLAFRSSSHSSSSSSNFSLAATMGIVTAVYPLVPL